MRIKKAARKPSSFKKKMDQEAAKAGLYELPIPALVATIDSMVEILAKRGVPLRDWDDKQKVVKKVKLIGNKAYILAPHEKPGGPEHENGECEQE